MCVSFENMICLSILEKNQNAEIEYANKLVKETFLLRNFSIGNFKQRKKKKKTKPRREGLMIKI